MTFFSHPPSDELYDYLRRPINPPCVEAAAHVEELWCRTHRFLDLDASKKASHGLHSVWWEMYLAATLLEAGRPLIARDRRRSRTKGPDFQDGHVDAWWEAVAASPGIGPNRVEQGNIGEVRAVPDDQITMRITAAIAAKQAKLTGYLASGVVLAGEPFVIAVNVGAIPSARLERHIPRIVRAVLPIGSEILTLDRSTLRTISTHHEYRPTIRKRNGAVVAVDTFLDASLGGVSAVVCGAADVFNVPTQLGQDLVLVHNPHAWSPLPRGFMARGKEYWVEGDGLHHTFH